MSEKLVITIGRQYGSGGREVGHKLAELLGGLKVEAGNDANMAALGEMWLGAGRGQKNMIMVTLGTGVGGGVIVNGKVLVGANGASGEIGHLCVNYRETDSCGCGNKGCLEQYASATGIARKAKKVFGNELTAKEVMDLAKAGNRDAEEVVRFMAKNLGKALAIISCVMDPEIFVIGGGVSKAGDYLLNMIREYFVQNAFHASEKAEFALAKLGNDAGIYGCVAMILA